MFMPDKTAFGYKAIEKSGLGFRKTSWREPVLTPNDKIMGETDIANVPRSDLEMNSI